MLWTTYFVLLFLILLGVAYSYGCLNDPKKCFFIGVAAISWINFSFFEGEVSSRMALPDFLFAVLLTALFFNKILRKDNRIALPLWPLIFSLTLLIPIFLSYTQPAWNRAFLWGEGQPLPLLLGIGVFFLVNHFLETEEDLRKFFFAWLIAAVFTLTIALIDAQDLFSSSEVQHYDPDGFFGMTDLFSNNTYSRQILSMLSFRIQGSFRSPGQLAAFSLTSMIVFLAFSTSPIIGRAFKNLPRVFILCFVGCIMFSTRSSVVLGLFVSTALLGIYFLRKMRRSRFLILVFAVSITGFVISRAISSNQLLYSQIFQRNWAGYTNLGASFLGEQFSIVLEIVKSNPIFGIGFGRYTQSEYHPFIRSYELHSPFLQFAAETGIPGLLGYLLFVAYFITIAYRNYRLAQGTPWAHFHAILYLGFCGMTASYLYNRHLRERTFWLFIGLIYAGHRYLLRLKQAKTSGNKQSILNGVLPDKELQYS